jgi:hypothetical protein
MARARRAAASGPRIRLAHCATSERQDDKSPTSRFTNIRHSRGPHPPRTTWLVPAEGGHSSARSGWPVLVQGSSPADGRSYALRTSPALLLFSGRRSLTSLADSREGGSGDWRPREARRSPNPGRTRRGAEPRRAYAAPVGVDPLWLRIDPRRPCAHDPDVANAINAIVRPSQSARRNATVRADVVRSCG